MELALNPPNSPPYNNWRSWVAIALLASPLVLLPLAYSHENLQRTTRRIEYSASRPFSPEASSKLPKQVDMLVERRCESMVAGDQAALEATRNIELCSQLLSAKSANRSAQLAWWQTFIGGAGLIFIALTLIFNGYATLVAVRSSKQSRELFTKERRAWLSVTGEFDPDREIIGALTTHVYFNIRVENVGPSPATNVFMESPDFCSVESYESDVVPRLQSLVANAKIDSKKIGISLLPGQHHTFERPIALLGSGPDDIKFNYIVGFVRYRIDGDSLVHITPFAWLVTVALLDGTRLFKHAGSVWQSINPD